MHIDDFNLCKTHYSVVYDHNFSQFIKQVAPLKNQFEYQHKMYSFFSVQIQMAMSMGIATDFLCSAMANMQATEHDDESNISIMQNCIQSDILCN